MESMFGNIDRTRDGVVASEYPAWAQVQQMDAFKEHIDQLERGIKSGRFSNDEIHNVRAEKAKLESRLDDMMKSKPKPGESERAMLYKHYRSLGTKIQASMFTRSDMKNGLASPREEAKRMKKPCIILEPDECGIALACNVKADGKKMVSRDAAAKVFKLLGKILGEPANIEVLRLDKKTETHIPMEIAAPAPVAAQHLEGTSQEEVKLNKDGTPDKRFVKKD
jgi:hypothetical protein